MATTSDETTFVPVDPETIAALYARYGLMPIGGGSQEHDEQDGDEADDENDEQELPADLGDKGKEAIKAERKKARDATRRLRDAEAELQQLRDAQTEAERLKQEEADRLALENGEAKAVAEKRLTELQAVTGERDALKTRLDQALTLLASSVETEWNDTPESVRKLFKGNADDALDKKAFLTEHADLIKELTGKQDAIEQKFAAASRTRTPTPDPTGKPTGDDEARKAQARTVSRF